MADFENQKAEKLTIRDVARKQLSGNILNEFESFLEFLKEEKINPVWKSINGFNVKYKGRTINSITLGAPGWLDNATLRMNYVSINVCSAERDDEDRYFKGLQSEIATLFMEQISNTCVHCRPTCGCSKVSGRTVRILDRQYDNICMNALIYKFFTPSDNMREFIICSPCALYPPIEIRSVPLETVKELILARKKYIVEML